MLCTDEDVMVCIALSVDQINARMEKNVILEFGSVTILCPQVVHRGPGYNVDDFTALGLGNLFLPSGFCKVK